MNRYYTEPLQLFLPKRGKFHAVLCVFAASQYQMPDWASVFWLEPKALGFRVSAETLVATQTQNPKGCLLGLLSQ